MESPNRRETFRFHFGYLRRPRAELACAVGEPPRLGALLNLSIDGAAFLLAEAIPPVRWTEDWFLRFTLKDRRDQPLPLLFLCRIMHGQATEQGHVFGLRFLPAGTASFEESRRLVWRYLVEQQSLSRSGSLT